MSKDDINIDQQVQQALEEVGINYADWKRRVSAGDVLYLLDQCPFLQITNTAVSSPVPLSSLTLVSARSGWKIHDYGGHALSSSPGELLFGGRRVRGKKNEEDEGGAIAMPGAGTLVNQAVITAFEMVELAKQHGWAGVQFVDGHPLMAWAAWMQAEDSDLGMEGYTPTARDYLKRRRIKGPAPTLERGPGPSRP